MKNYTSKFASDSTILFTFGDTPSVELSQQVLKYFNIISALIHYPITNLHPAYCSLLIKFDSSLVKPVEFLRLLQKELINSNFSHSENFNTIEIPVQYGGIFGEDLEEVARLTDLSVDDVVKLHTETEYTVAFLGFSPGFPYLLGLNPKLVCPRKPTPRTRVPSRSVAIAGIQTGIYPTDSPGGWQLLGRTTINLFDPNRNEPSQIKPGDRIKFKAVLNYKTENSTDRHAIDTEKDDFALRIDNPGFFSSLQDLGRDNWAHLGVSSGGAADPLALEMANLLVSNKANAAGIEMTASGVTVTFLKDTWFALAGGEADATLDEWPIKMWTSIPVCSGQRLVVKSIKHQLRCYLAVHGGFNVKPILNSRSTFISAKWGGLEGRNLQKDDQLKIGTDYLMAPTYKKVSPAIEKLYKNSNIKILRVTEGPQLEWFQQNSLDVFYEKTFEVTQDVNRLGVRLEGEKLEYSSPFQGKELISEGIANGSIQVAQSGQPMILFCEQQSTGGYPKIANVISADLFRIGQLKPFDLIQFKKVSLEEAWFINHDFNETINRALDDK